MLDCTPLLSGAPLDDQAAARLGVLADPGRLRILSLIQSQLSHEACVCHLTDSLEPSQPTVSHHLRVLYEAGLVDRERRGNWVYYWTVATGTAAGPEGLVWASLSWTFALETDRVPRFA
jgi:ArsR family transcriptional regulator